MMLRLVTALLASGFATQTQAAPEVEHGSNPTPSASAPNLPKNVIEDLQRRLIQTGYLQGVKASTSWNAKTPHAIQLFQKDYGLPPNGEPDDPTLKALNIDAELQHGKKSQ